MSQSRRARIHLFVAALVMLLGKSAEAQFLAGTCPGATHVTVQAAVNAATAGDTIDVCAGTFIETVTVNKTLTLRGAQAGVDARTGRPAAAESIMTGAGGASAFLITANNVVIDGFTIQGTTSITLSAGVSLGGGTSGSQILNNIIQNNVNGLHLANNSGTASTLIQFNLFRTNNIPGPVSGTAIYSDQFVSGGTVQNVVIDSNAFSGNTDAALSLSSTSAAAPATNITFTNNTSTGDGRMVLLFNTTNSVISGNTVQNSTFVNSADLRIFEGVANLLITGNTLQNGIGRALRVSNLGTGAPNATGIVMIGNSITGYPTSPVVSFDAGTYTGVFNAECNWWGSATGPTNASNPGGTGQSVGDGIDFRPWLLAPPPGGECAGGATVTATQGTPQSTTVGTAFSTALEVTVTADGSPLSGVSVTFTPVAGAGGASGSFGGPTTVTTNGSGVATAPTLTANTTPGSFTVTATVGTATATFNLTNIAGAPAAITPTQGNNQSTATNTQFPVALQATVTDSFGNPLTGQTVTFTPVPGGSGATGTFSGLAVTTTDASGVAAAPTLTANGVAGPFTVTATSGALTATFDLENLSTALSVVKTDAGDVYTGENITFTIAVTNSGAANALDVQLTDTILNPLVSFAAPAGWACTTPAGGATGTITCDIAALPPGTAAFTLVVTAPSTAGVVSNTATVTATTETSPASGSQTVNVLSPPTVAIQDSSAAEGLGTMTFNVVLTGTALRPVTVDFSTADGTATAPADYATTTGTVTFAVGVTTQSITVPIVADAVSEPDETFLVNLTNPTEATVSDNQAVGTIISGAGANIPTMSQWMLLLMALALAGVGVWKW